MSLPRRALTPARARSAVKPARQMFAYSVLYLFLIFTLLIADRFALALAVRPFGAMG